MVPLGGQSYNPSAKDHKEVIKKVVEQKLGLKPGETTPDGQFSYQPVECLAGCHTGPCMQVNDDYHEHLTPKKMEELIEELKKK